MYALKELKRVSIYAIDNRIDIYETVRRGGTCGLHGARETHGSYEHLA